MVFSVCSDYTVVPKILHFLSEIFSSALQDSLLKFVFEIQVLQWKILENQDLPNLIVNNVRMWRGVERIDGLQDVMCQVGQVHNRISHHCFYTGSTSHKKRNGRMLRTQWLHGLHRVVLWGDIKKGTGQIIFTKKLYHVKITCKLLQIFIQRCKQLSL